MSLYKFSKDSKRLFMQGTTSNSPSPVLGPPIVTSLDQVNGDAENLQAIHTKKRLSTEVLGSSLETIKTNRRGEDGSRRITTRIVRKVTTLTRGEEQSRAEDLLKRAQQKSIQSAEDVAASTGEMTVKRVKVSISGIWFRSALQ